MAELLHETTTNEHVRGTHRLRHAETNDIILVPTPSDDPADPLRWSQPFKIYVALLVCCAQFFGNFVMAGPSSSLIPQAIEFGSGNPEDLPYWIGQVSYFITASTLLAGIGNFFWVPIITKYGRRPVYVFSLTIVVAATVWCGAAKSFGVELAGRIILGFAVGAAECVAPCTIADIFFLHERGLWMGLYFFAVGVGVTTGAALGGVITIRLPWPYTYWVTLAFNGLVLILVAISLPETYFQRSAGPVPAQVITITAEDENKVEEKAADRVQNIEDAGRGEFKPVSFFTPLRDLKIFHGPRTAEPLWKTAYRPFVLIVLPNTLWCVAVLAVNIGGLIVLTTTVPAAFPLNYGFTSWQTGLTFFSGTIGGSLALVAGGWMQDKIADHLTKKNHGIREAEMTLPALILPTIVGMLAYILYGAAFEYHWHWIVPTIAIGLQSFCLISSSAISTVYIIESYRPIAGELVVCGMGYKSALAFLLSFYVNPWIERNGYFTTMGIIAGLLGFFHILAIPLYFYGKRIRVRTMTWKVMKLVEWHEDREVGE